MFKTHFSLPLEKFLSVICCHLTQVLEHFLMTPKSLNCLKICSNISLGWFFIFQPKNLSLFLVSTNNDSVKPS